MGLYLLLHQIADLKGSCTIRHHPFMMEVGILLPFNEYFGNTPFFGRSALLFVDIIIAHRSRNVKHFLK